MTRQAQALALRAKGKSWREIALEMDVAISTARSMVAAEQLRLAGKREVTPRFKAKR